MSDAPHMPVSSESALVGYSDLALSSPPSEGDAAETGATLAEALHAGDDGIEDVPGYVGAEGAAADLWTPPTADLTDVGEASFGPPPPQAETVHGPDDRVQITNPSVYPWRAQCSLAMTAADGSRWIGSGTFIGDVPLRQWLDGQRRSGVRLRRDHRAGQLQRRMARLLESR